MNWKKITLGGSTILLLLLSSFVIWAMTPSGPSDTATDALQSTTSVSVEQNDFIVFSPTKTDPTKGLIFYPGGRVDERSYAPLAQQIAAKGFLVVIVPMPLHLAVIAPNKANHVIDTYQYIEIWAIAGHSLGGSMTASYVADHPNTISALYLLASYTTEENNLTEYDLTVLSIYGTEDKILSKNMNETMELLPHSARLHPILGGNHAYFGNYGEQRGDGKASITREKQQQITTDFITNSMVML